MTTQHTPGPWYSQPTAGHETHGQSAIASEATGKTVALAYDGEADARLLAAAPELLEALNNLAGGLVDYMNDDEAELPDVTEAIELIAKITNEPVMAA
jgi:hypothetical protein